MENENILERVAGDDGGRREGLAEIITGSVCGGADSQAGVGAVMSCSLYCVHNLYVLLSTEKKINLD